MPEANPRSVIGSNTPDAIDYAKEETDRLARDYRDLYNTVEDLNGEAGKIPDEIPNPQVKEVVVDLIKRIRDVKVRVSGLHELEKQPHFRRGQGVDQFFFGLWDALLKRDKKNRDGIGDILGKKLTNYDVRILAEEQERRRKEAAETARVAAIAEAARIEQERIAEEARLSAERARKPETTFAKEAIAEQAETAASAARVDEAVAVSRAEDAYIPTLARPAEIMRTRTAGGTLSTMQQEAFAEIDKVELLDIAKLWPFIKYEAKQAALNQWAKSTDYREQMAGAKIGRRPKSTVR